MNVLTGKFSNVLEISSGEFPIRSDFRTALLCIMAFEDDDLTSYEKHSIMLRNIYKEMPENVEGAIIAAMNFLSGKGILPDNKSDEEEEIRCYSFTKDAALIFAAFRQTHGIDLEKEDFHWLKFLTLFMDLGAETTFCNLVALRRRLKTNTATKEERELADSMPGLIDIPEYKTPEEREKESEFMALVDQARARRKK